VQLCELINIIPSKTAKGSGQSKICTEFSSLIEIDGETHKWSKQLPMLIQAAGSVVSHID
jgi:hypothetical protein